MPLYQTDIDQASGNVCTFSANYQIAVVEAGATLVAETASGFVSTSFSAETVYNSGNIYAAAIGIYFIGGSGGDTIYNYGLIGAGAYGQAAVYDSNGYGTIFNGGRITGSQSGVFISGVSTSLTNTGTISAPTGVEIHGTSEVVTNRGIIDGNVLSELGTSLTLRNAGTINGSVTFGYGSNIFNGRGGTVDGTITGGSGVDRIFAGNDGEVMDGGAGHDALYGGAGADTFAFSSFASADSDRIHSFDVNQDTIQFDHTKFTKLVADSTPTFAIATAATSATDYLFYNSGTGGLYYDLDGSGSRTPYLVATLDKGLNLTANNFSVV